MNTVAGPTANKRFEVRDAPVKLAPLRAALALPAGAMAIDKNGQTCCLGGNTRVHPAFGANGLHCTPVAAP